MQRDGSDRQDDARDDPDDEEQNREAKKSVLHVMDSAGGACLRLIFFAGAPVRSTRLAQKGCMQLSPAPSPRSTSRNRTTARVSGHRSAPLSCPQQGSPEASAEIHAYIAARDMAMADAERRPTDLSLNRAFLANEMVENCLRPARSPYHAQALPVGEVVRALQRCEVLKRRIHQLRACILAAA